MAKYAIDGTTLTDIADAIRNKNASSEKMTPADMIHYAACCSSP